MPTKKISRKSKKPKALSTKASPKLRKANKPQAKPKLLKQALKAVPAKITSSKKSNKPKKPTKKQSSAKKSIHHIATPSKPNRPSKQTSQSSKPIYEFGKKTDGNVTLRTLLGGKGANLAEMARIGLPVPPGFTITTEICNYFTVNKSLPKNFDAEINKALKNIEKQSGKTFGDSKNPLLFSVRSGARDSMPGMMDTILNLGLNDKTVAGLALKTNNERFAYDCYRRLVQMYGDVVMGVQSRHEHEHEPFEEILHQLKTEKNVEQDNNLSAEDLKELITRFKNLIQERTGKNFPQNVHEQLDGAIKAVFKSWDNERAFVYRQKYNIPHNWGTAVNVQAMVFGNMGDSSATGVAFTRDPANGEKVFYGEYLINAQGEDVVAGTRTPKPISLLEREMPHAYKELQKIRSTLEKHFKDMQDFEFTIENQKLYMLQTRNGKRTGLAAVRIAVEMVKERLIDQKTAIKRIPADSIACLLVPVFDAEDRKKAKLIGHGLPAGPGAASGQIVFSASVAETLERQGTKVILCRQETTPEDIRGMLAAEGILTSRGGVSSHAALVARQMGKVCVCGASNLIIDYKKGTLTAKGVTLKEGDNISIDGTTGEVFEGHVKTAPSEVNQVLMGKLKPSQSYTYQLFKTIMEWADKYRTLNVRTNADTPEQSRMAVHLGAEGIGLCRTEHMFFEGDRINHMRQMILATNKEERAAALQKLLPLQRQDFEGIFQTMEGRPVTIRLLDPPLHEFLPFDDHSRNSLVKELNVSLDTIIERTHSLHEQNPMLGHRGCRLGISYPEITEMQVKAIFEAALSASKNTPVNVEIMIPLTGFSGELKHQTEIVHKIAKDILRNNNHKRIKYSVGTMIELPRAALQAHEIAESADFFSFGTNDLTQTTLGMSRDDSGSFLPLYKDLDILPQNPFATIDQKGVGQLVELAVERGRSTSQKLKCGICGEHGGDPDSIKFFHKAGLNYVSCSPPRIPVARLAAAQAVLEKQV